MSTSTKEAMEGLVHAIVRRHEEGANAMAQMRQMGRERRQQARHDAAQRHQESAQRSQEASQESAQRSQEASQRRGDVATMLKAHTEARANMGSELRAGAEALRAELAQEKAQLEREVQQEAAQRRSDVAAMLKKHADIQAGYRRDQAGARAAWQKMSDAVHGKRDGSHTAEGAPAPATTKEATPAAATQRAAPKKRKPSKAGRSAG